MRDIGNNGIKNEWGRYLYSRVCCHIVDSLLKPYWEIVGLGRVGWGNDWEMVGAEIPLSIPKQDCQVRVLLGLLETNNLFHRLEINEQ